MGTCNDKIRGPSKHQKSYRPSFGLSLRANGTSPVKFTKLQVLHTCTKNKLKDHKGIDFLCCFSSWHLITLHMFKYHKRFCWNKCVVHGIFQKNDQSNSAQIFFHHLRCRKKVAAKLSTFSTNHQFSPRFSLRQEHGQGGPNQGTPNRQGERMALASGI